MLRGSPEFTAVLEWIAENRDDATEECCKQLDNAKAKRSQGSRMALQHILDSNDEAPKILDKFNQN